MKPKKLRNKQKKLRRLTAIEYAKLAETTDPDERLVICRRIAELRKGVL